MTLYFHRCKYRLDLYKQIVENKDTDEDSKIAYKAMLDLQKLVSNFLKYG